jgi:hypothetical protein
VSTHDTPEVNAWLARAARGLRCSRCHICPMRSMSWSSPLSRTGLYQGLLSLVDN